MPRYSNQQGKLVPLAVGRGTGGASTQLAGANLSGRVQPRVRYEPPHVASGGLGKLHLVTSGRMRAQQVAPQGPNVDLPAPHPSLQVVL